MKRLVLQFALTLAVAWIGMALLGSATSLAGPQEKSIPQEKKQSAPKGKKPEKVYEVPAGDGLKIEGELKVGDPKDKVKEDSHHKVYLVKLAAGKKYTIDMDANDEDELDAFLRLEDAAGKELAVNDDANEDTLNASIDFRCERTGTYRIICTSYTEGETGPFTLKIKQAK